jgi:hypothetical protein
LIVVTRRILGLYDEVRPGKTAHDRRRTRRPTDQDHAAHQAGRCLIPTYSPWLNQVERAFSLIMDKAIRRRSFTSVRQLVQRIDTIDKQPVRCPSASSMRSSAALSIPAAGPAHRISPNDRKLAEIVSTRLGRAQQHPLPSRTSVQD